MYELTAGAVETIMNGGEVIHPVVQVLGSKAIAGQGGSNDRYRLLISDGVHLNSFAMLATQLTPMLSSGKLADHSVIKITNHVVSVVKNPGKGDKRIMVILGMEVLKHGSEVGQRIGNPVQLKEQSTNTSTNPSAQTIQPEPPTKQPVKQNDIKPRMSFNETKFNSPSNQTSPTHPIISLSPYQNTWTIKARVTSKSSIRTWSNPRSEGKLFSMDLVDSSGEIRATCFKEQVDKFYDLIQENKVYFISKGKLKMANKQYTTINNNFELTFTSETKVTPCEEEDTSIPTLQFNFITLSGIQETAPNTLLDFIGVCKSAGDVVNLTSRTTNRELKKRDVTLVDSSLASVVLTLWGTQAEEFNSDGNPVIAVKGGKVSEFNGGKTVSLISGSVLQINPDLPDSHRLRGWFDCLTPDAKFNAISSRTQDVGGGKSYMLGEAVSAQLGCGDKADYFSSYATIMHVKTERSVYKACPTSDCQKKVIDQNNGLFRCEKCNKEFSDYKYRLMLQVNIGDFSGNQWVTLFQDSGEELLGCSANDIGKWQEEKSPSYDDAFKNITLKPFQFRLRAKMENFNDESRLKMTVISVKKPDLKERCRKLLSEIKEMSGISIGAK